METADKTEDAIVVLVTAGSREEAARLAEMLVGERLAACVQIMPEMESIYYWQGSVHREERVSTAGENHCGELQRSGARGTCDS